MHVCDARGQISIPYKRISAARELKSTPEGAD